MRTSVFKFLRPKDITGKIPAIAMFHLRDTESFWRGIGNWSYSTKVRDFYQTRLNEIYAGGSADPMLPGNREALKAILKG